MAAFLATCAERCAYGLCSFGGSFSSRLRVYQPWLSVGGLIDFRAVLIVPLAAFLGFVTGLDRLFNSAAACAADIGEIVRTATSRPVI